MIYEDFAIQTKPKSVYASEHKRTREGRKNDG